MRFILSLLTWWRGQTIGFQLFTWRKGVRVGADELGNVYYRTQDDKRRWVMFAGEPEATKVSPDWHGWLHFTWNETPEDKPLAHKSWEKEHHENLTGTAMAYAPSGSIRQARPADRSDYEAWSPE